MAHHRTSFWIFVGVLGYDSDSMASVRTILWGAISGLGIIVLGLSAALLLTKARQPAGAEPTAAAAPAIVAPPPEPPPRDPFIEETLRDLRDPNRRGSRLALWRDTSHEVSYSLLERGAETHRGKRVYIVGRVAQVMDLPDGVTMARIATRGRFDNIYYVESAIAPSERVVEGTRVVVPAVLAGAHTYQAQSGWNITLPAALAMAIIPKDEADREIRAVPR